MKALRRVVTMVQAGVYVNPAEQQPGAGASSGAAEVPDRIGRYRILAPLAEGGMARVFIAQKEGATEVCVLKQLLLDLRSNEVAAKRFVREAHAASHLIHPRIARILDAGVEGESFIIAMELIQGIDFESMIHSLMKQTRMVPYQVTISAISGVLEGLDYAHNATDAEGVRLELVHRDLSPRNMLLGFDGFPRVIDFGLARGKFDDFKTAPGMILGTFRYMSPEQAITAPVDARSDLYSVGVVLHEMLTGQMLVPPKPTPQEILRVVLHQPAPRLSEVNPNLPKKLDDVVARAVAKKRDDRWPSAAEFRAALLDAAGELAQVTPDQIQEFLAHQFPEEKKHAEKLSRLGQKLSDAPKIETTQVLAGRKRAAQDAPAVSPVGPDVSEEVLHTRTGYNYAIAAGSQTAVRLIGETSSSSPPGTVSADTDVVTVPQTRPTSVPPPQVVRPDPRALRREWWSGAIAGAIGGGFVAAAATAIFMTAGEPPQPIVEPRATQPEIAAPMAKAPVHAEEQPEARTEEPPIEKTAPPKEKAPRIERKESPPKAKLETPTPPPPQPKESPALASLRSTLNKIRNEEEGAKKRFLIEYGRAVEALPEGPDKTRLIKRASDLISTDSLELEEYERAFADLAAASK